MTKPQAEFAENDEKISFAVNLWKNRLLDLTKRNRALNFKPTKVSTVSMLNEKSAEVFRLLCFEEETLKFKAKPASRTEEKRDVNEESLTSGENSIDKVDDDDTSFSFPISPEFVPYESSELLEHQTSDYLLTNASTDKLDKSLLRIEQLAQLSFEEQGVNSLFLTLGMLEYNESKNSEVFYKAPLIFIPVKLMRKSANTGFAIKESDDEVIVNPSLSEYLLQNYSTPLPEMPDFQNDNESFDLQKFFIEIKNLFSAQKDWKIKDEIQLGLFSFQKLVMYKDIEKNADILAVHKIIRKVITRSGDHYVKLPQEIDEMELDKEFAPENEHQIVDADSSQLRAIAAVSRQHDLVLEGPPGTGKSQTITNLIAQTLSEGKSVLFVAEKMAALDVVYRRLVDNRLGEFCLELHSTKANKRSVMQEVKNSLDSSIEEIAVFPHKSRANLPKVRQELTDYANAVHKPYGKLNKTPYQVYGELERVLDAPRTVLQNNIFEYTEEQIHESLRHVKNISDIVKEIGLPKRHPWRETSKTYYSEDDLDGVKSLGSEILQNLTNISEQSGSIENSYGLPEIKRFSDIETTVELSSFLANSPGVPRQVLTNELWNSPPSEAEKLIQKGKHLAALRKNVAKISILNDKRYQNLPADFSALVEDGKNVIELREEMSEVSVLTDKTYQDVFSRGQDLIQKGIKITNLEDKISNKFNGTVYSYNPTEEIKYIEEKLSGIFSFLAFLDKKYRRIKKTWISYRLPVYKAKLIQQIADMKDVTELIEENQKLDNESELGGILFGSLWEGKKSNWKTLTKFIAWVKSFQEVGLKGKNLDESDVTFLQERTSELDSLICDYKGHSSNYISSWTKMKGDLATLQDYHQAKTHLQENSSKGSELFGSLWNGEDSNWANLTRYVNWLKDLKEFCVENKLNHTSPEKAVDSPHLLSELKRLENERESWRALVIENQKDSQNYSTNWNELEQDLRSVTYYVIERNSLNSNEKFGLQLFGNHWQGETSNWGGLEDYISWVTEFRHLFIKHNLREQVLTTVTQAQPDISATENLKDLIDQTNAKLITFCGLAGLKEGCFENQSVLDIRKRVQELVRNIDLAQPWAAFENIRKKIEQSVIGELLPKAMNEKILFTDLEKVFLRAFYQKWLTQVVQERAELRSFHTLTHEQRVKEFREMDECVLKENRESLVNLLRDNLQNRLRDDKKVKDEMSHLRSQLNKQRGLAPLRVTIKRSLSAIRAIKPCFMMSPLSVAQLLDAEKAKFDLVIFDEASQLPTEDAVGTILRGKQLVVVGDPKQLPPTNFFAVQTGQVNLGLDEDGLPLYEDSQSILEEAMSAGVSQARLKWHYRSAHESLITFSNVNFYDADLYTFPSVENNSLESGLHFEYVEEGVYEGKGLNLKEAQALADAVVNHIKNKPELTLGVGTFNLRQQIAIQDILEEKRREDPSIESFFDRSVKEPFFVKNLENIQGDERDVIFLSVTYAKGNDGKMRYRLGPLNGENGWRRLNVLTTRARKLMRVFSSIRSDEINLAATASSGAKLLRDFLTYAEHKRLDSPTLSALAETESPFEREVLKELQRKNYNVEPQIGACGYRIDLGILDNEIKGRFICGIECDGVSYHSSQTARDRDRLRQQVLEGRGWDIHRVWSTDWFKDRPGQIERLVKLIEKSKKKKIAQNERDAEEERWKYQELEETNEVDNISYNLFETEYKRPEAKPYQMMSDEQIYFFEGLLDAQISTLANEIISIIEIEAPIHIKDLVIRTAAMWGQRTGRNIVARINYCLNLLEKNEVVFRKDEYIWKPNNEPVVRSRNGTNIPAERIAPEEIQEAVLMVLRAGKEFTRQELINEVRAVFGFSRTGPSLQQAIDAAVEDLLKQRMVGEGGIGIAMRQTA